VPPPAQRGTHKGKHKIDEKGAGGTFCKIDKKREERQVKDESIPLLIYESTYE
jgi:hypothetical protein